MHIHVILPLSMPAFSIHKLLPVHYAVFTTVTVSVVVVIVVVDVVAVTDTVAVLETVVVVVAVTELQSRC